MQRRLKLPPPILENITKASNNKSESTMEINYLSPPIIVHTYISVILL